MPKKRDRPLLQHMEVGESTPAYHPAPDCDSPDRPPSAPYVPPIDSCPRLSPEGASKGLEQAGESVPTSPSTPLPDVAVKQPIRGVPAIGKDSSETSLLRPDSHIGM